MSSTIWPSLIDGLLTVTIVVLAGYYWYRRLRGKAPAGACSGCTQGAGCSLKQALPNRATKQDAE